MLSAAMRKEPLGSIVLWSPHAPEVGIWETKRAYRREGAPSLIVDLLINRTSFGLELATSPNKKAPGRSSPSGSVAILPLQTDGKEF
jgi:hypothetical protein